jgi:UDP-glucose 4-epimerase
VLDDLSTGHRENLEEIGGDLDFIEGSVADEALLNKVLDGVEVVFHEAAIPSVPRSVEAPRQTTSRQLTDVFVAVAARDKRVRRVVYAASSSRMAISRRCRSLSRCCPIRCRRTRWRNWSVSITARCSRGLRLETVSLRYFNVFGPRQDPGSQYSGVVSRFHQLAVVGERPVIYGDGEQSRDFTYIDNVVAANLSAATSKARRERSSTSRMGSGSR